MNLIYIFADQWRRDVLGIYDSRVKTPNLDAFAEESAVFDRAYSSCPLCSPNRACLLTGKQPRNTNVFTNCKPGVDAYLPEDTVCVSDVLKAQGFHTGYIGKWHLDKPDGDDPNNWDAYTMPGKRRHGFDFWYSYGAHNRHSHPYYWTTEGEYVEVDEWSPKHETDVALQFLKENKDNKFALFISYNPPHTPYDQTPEKYQNLYTGEEKDIKAVTPAPEGAGDKLGANWNQKENVKGYYGAVSGIDENIGRIISYLKENDHYEDTYIFISADHGDMLGDHGRFAKHIWYEGSVGIPLIIGGGDIKPMRTDTLVGGPDQTAAILGLLGLPIPESMQAKDFSPLLRGESFEEYESIMTVSFPNTKERIEEFQAHGKNFMDYGWRSIITKEYKLAILKGMSYGEKPQTFLFDLKRDPYENINIHDDDVMQMMMKELKKWCDATGDGFLDDLECGE